MRRTRQTRRAERRARRPRVECLEARELLSTAGTDYAGIVGAAQVRSAYNVDGSGETVAVIDTGVDYKNPALGGGFGPGNKVVAGYDFADNAPDPNAGSWQHGTAVAGLIASSDPAHLGIAPGAEIAALRVFNNNNQGDFTWVADALQWVIDHHDQYHITAVNLSISDGGNYTQNVYAHDGGVGQEITGLIGQLDALNIPVITATGNNFQGQQGEGFTAIVPDTISVTATDASDHLLSNAQRLGAIVGGASATKIAAPGQAIVAPSGDSGFSSGDGTSFAAPIVSGAVVLLQEIYQQRFGHLPTVSQLASWLQQGSDPVVDPVTGIVLGRLDLPRAASLIPTPAAETLTPPPPQTPPQQPTPQPQPQPTPQPSPPPVASNPGSGQGGSGASGSGSQPPGWQQLFDAFSHLFQTMRSQAGAGQSAAGSQFLSWNVKTGAPLNSAQDTPSFVSWNVKTGAQLSGSQMAPTGSLRPLHSPSQGHPTHPRRSGFVWARPSR